jgi:hypothetical protein
MGESRPVASRRGLALAPSIALCFAGGCGGESPPQNLILVTIDTLRQDRLGV